MFLRTAWRESQALLRWNIVACCEDEGEDFCSGASCHGEGCFIIESRVDEEEEEEEEEDEEEMEAEEEEAN